VGSVRVDSHATVLFVADVGTIEGWVRLATLYDPDGNVLMLAQSLL